MTDIWFVEKDHSLSLWWMRSCLPLRMGNTTPKMHRPCHNPFKAMALTLPFSMIVMAGHVRSRGFLGNISQTWLSLCLLWEDWSKYWHSRPVLCACTTSGMFQRWWGAPNIGTPSGRPSRKWPILSAWPISSWYYTSYKWPIRLRLCKNVFRGRQLCHLLARI